MNHRLLFVSLIACGLVAQVRGAESTPAAPAAPAPVAAASAEPSHKPGDVVARVNGGEIKFKDLDMACKAVRSQMARSNHAALPQDSQQLERSILEEMVTREVILQEGKKQVPADLDTKVQEQLEQLKKQVGGEEEFVKTLSENNVAKDEFVQQLRDNIIIQQTVEKYVEGQVKIAPEEVKDFYEKNLPKFKVPETVRASHILVTVPADATEDVKKAKKAQIEAARTLVKGGEPFADVAKKVSECPSKAKGGDLGFFSRQQMVPSFSDAAFSLPTNQVSEVVTTQFGYHIILVTDKKPSHEQTLDEVRERLTDYLRMKKSSEVAQTYVKNLREKAKVEILLESATAPAPAAKPATTVETPPVAAPKK